MTNATGMFEPSIQPLIEELVTNGRVGICSSSMKLLDVQTGQSPHAKKPNADRFRLIIPYAGESLIWDVMFIGNSPDHPPDFCFDDKSFAPELTKLETLSTWDKENSQVLWKLIEELLRCYRDHQIAQIEEHSRLHFEYTTLLQIEDLTASDVEILVTKKNRNGPINFLLKLPVNFSKIPAELLAQGDSDKLNSGDGQYAIAVLLMTFNSPDGTKITPQLFLPPNVERALGGPANLRVPAFPNGGCLMDYVPSVCLALRNKVEQITTGFDKRKEYVLAFQDSFGSCMLEYDAVTFRKLTLLLDVNTFFFILYISLPVYFPQDKPHFVFQSVTHGRPGRPYSSSCPDYPYSPRWDGEEMVLRARSYIMEFVPQFRAIATRSYR